MTNPIWKREERFSIALQSLYRRYGYIPYKMSRFEEYDLYVRNKDFLVSDQIITFSDRSGRLLALKPDVTLSIVKNAPEQPGVVQKVYYNENVYRDYREILQTGLECVGDLGDYEIAEVVLLAAKSLQLMEGAWVLDISHMGLLAAVLDDSGLSREQQNLAMEYLHRKNIHQLKALCGDWLVWEQLSAIAACRGGREALEQLETVLTTDAQKQELRQLKRLWQVLEASGCGDSVRLDFSVGNNMRYYSGVVFRGYLEGVPASVLSGGQYDKLPRKMGRNAKAIGFAVYLDRLENREEEPFDVDTLILHDGTADPLVLTAAAEEAAEKGSVLVTRELPETRSWKHLRRFEKGVWVL
ncbi:MAG: ATP phosphoribosyltransferase regulatory subunit [Oscillospiraceae bacterium]|nr:ATP phosphoribosyltransferase regulatory subunit [Oscillospiraceae bacterium]